MTEAGAPGGGDDRVVDTSFDWGEHPVPDDGIARLSVGPLELRFTQRASEIRLSLARTGERGEPRWRRWAATDGWNGRIRLSPTLPDRTVVVKPDDEFSLMREARARIFVRVPLSVRVEALGDRSTALLTVPTVILSDTWWGTQDEGELCYFLDTKARRRVQDEDFAEHLCICPLELRNRSQDDLLVTRIALRTRYLTVYRDGDQIWADETRVGYRGEVEGSSLEVAGTPPAEAGEPVLMSAPLEPMDRGFSARTFALLKHSLGGWIG